LSQDGIHGAGEEGGAIVSGNNDTDLHIGRTYNIFVLEFTSDSPYTFGFRPCPMKKFTSLSLSRYLKELCSKKPIPGGGSASAYVAALGMGLAEMVAGIGIAKLDSGSQASLRKAMRVLAKARKDALQAVDLDPQVYQAVLKSYKKAKGIQNEEKKNRLIDEALENSFRLQADLALLIIVAKESARSFEGIRGSIKNDLKVSAALLNAAFQGAYDTARINVVYLKDAQKKSRAEQALEELKRRFESINAFENVSKS